MKKATISQSLMGRWCDLYKDSANEEYEGTQLRRAPRYTVLVSSLRLATHMLPMFISPNR